MKDNAQAQKFCGNCDSHNCYEYPSKIFCSTRHAQGKNPIVDALGCCGEWNRVSQECYCVREAKRVEARRGNGKVII
ncbi:MAG: hypothetical protein ACE14S_12730 [Candidatus Bathyarchaeia archaeon]